MKFTPLIAKPLIFLLSIFFVSCSTPSKKIKTPMRTAATEHVLEGAEQITQIGVNDSAHFSPYLNKIIFLSSARTHSNWQVYELDLIAKTEKRLTHQDGDVQQIRYFEDDKTILYNSTTDEIKEFPKTILPFLVNIPQIQKQKIWQDELSPSEIYLSDLKGLEIERITEQLGFDGFPVPVENGRFIFVSQNQDNWQLRLKNSVNKSQVTIKESQKIIYTPDYNSKTKQILWLEYDAKSNEVQLLISDIRGQKNQSYALKTAVYQKAIWKAQNELILSAKLNNADYFELYHFQIDSSCLRSLVHFEGDTLSPSLSPDSEQLLFTFKSKDLQHIYKMKTPEPNGTCL